MAVCLLSSEGRQAWETFGEVLNKALCQQPKGVGRNMEGGVSDHQAALAVMG